MQPVCSENFCHFPITSCSREKRYQALHAFPYCKWRKAGRGLGTRLFKNYMSNFCVAHHLLNIVTMNILCSQIVVFEIDCIISLCFNCVSHMTMCKSHDHVCRSHDHVCRSHENVWVIWACTQLLCYVLCWLCMYSPPLLITIVVANQRNFRLLGTVRLGYGKVPRL